jgi:hypothetical protein
MTQAKTSAEVLSKIWEDFARAAEKATGLPVRKSATSRNYLSGDNRLLTRWLNPGAHKNWRIPLARIPEVCSELNASPQLTDKLMMARFSEISDDDPKHPVLVAAWWALQQCERQNHGLSTDEERVLKSYREQTLQYPRGLSGAPDESTQMSQLFAALLRHAQQDQEDESQAEELSATASLELKRRARAVSKSLEDTAIANAAETRRAAHASKKAFALQVSDYLKGLQGKRP